MAVKKPPQNIGAACRTTFPPTSFLLPFQTLIRSSPIQRPSLVPVDMPTELVVTWLPTPPKCHLNKHLIPLAISLHYRILPKRRELFVIQLIYDPAELVFLKFRFAKH